MKSVAKCPRKTDNLASNEVEKNGNLSDQIIKKTSGDIPSIITEKTGSRLCLKSAKTAPISVVKKCESAVACLPDPEIGNVSRGPMVRGKVRKSVKEMKKEIEMKSMRPLTSYFEKRSQILNTNQEGMSNQNDEKNLSNRK